VDAANFLRESRSKELRSLGLNESQIAGQIQQDIIGVAAMAYRDAANFAERVYAASQARGYAPKPKPGTTPPADAEKLETIERGQKLSSGLGSAGSAPPSDMTAKRLADMSSAEFDSWCSKHPAQAQRLLGG
jgi:hypothetical protein